MQSLSICSSKCDILEVPKFEFHVGSASFGSLIKRRRAKRLELHGTKRPGFVLVSRYSMRNGTGASCRTSQFDLGSGCFCGHNTKVFLYSKHRSSVGTRHPLGWALEEQAISGGVSDIVSKENLQQGNAFLKEAEGEIVENVEKDALPLNSNGSTEDVGVGTEGGDLEEKKKGRIDVRGLSQSLQLAESVEEIDELLKDKDELPLQVFSSIIRGFGREKKLEPAMAIVDWLKQKHKENNDFDGPNLFIYNSLLGAVKQSGQIDKVEVVMNDMVEAGISPNVVTYNTLMGIYLDQGRAVEALNLFEEIQLKGLSPSPASYSTALLAYRRSENGNGALKLFVSLREKYSNGELRNDDGEDWDTELIKLKSFTSRICYQVMRRWLVKDGNFTTNVLKLLIEMDKADLPPTHEECERLVWACTREEHCPVAKELYSRIRERHSGISLSVCNHLIWLMGKARKWWAALEIYEDLLEKGPKPNNLSDELILSHFNVLLSAARKRGIWRWGVRLLNKMEEKGLKPGSREWNAVLIACSKASETTAAVEIFKRMIEKGEKPTIISYGALLSALEKGKLYDEAVRVWEHMLKVGLEPNLYAYTIMASVYVGLGKFHLVDYIIQEMVSTGNNPTVVTFNAIISVCGRNGMGGVAYEWFQRMKTMSIEPNEITYEMLIDALTKDGKPRLAYEIYLKALNQGFNPSAQAYDAVIQSSQTFGATIDINSLGPRPAEKKKVVTRKNSSELPNLGDDPRRSLLFDRQENFAQQAGREL